MKPLDSTNMGKVNSTVLIYSRPNLEIGLPLSVKQIYNLKMAIPRWINKSTYFNNLI